jgi:hypothetical protein
VGRGGEGSSSSKEGSKEEVSSCRRLQQGSWLAVQSPCLLLVPALLLPLLLAAACACSVWCYLCSQLVSLVYIAVGRTMCLSCRRGQTGFTSLQMYHQVAAILSGAGYKALSAAHVHCAASVPSCPEVLYGSILCEDTAERCFSCSG